MDLNDLTGAHNAQPFPHISLVESCSPCQIPAGYRPGQIRHHIKNFQLISHSQGQVQRPVIEDVRQPFAEGSLSVLFHFVFSLAFLFIFNFFVLSAVKSNVCVLYLI
jgi:hypothetical protein